MQTQAQIIDDSINFSEAVPMVSAGFVRKKDLLMKLAESGHTSSPSARELLTRHPGFDNPRVRLQNVSIQTWSDIPAFIPKTIDAIRDYLITIGYFTLHVDVSPKLRAWLTDSRMAQQGLNHVVVMHKPDAEGRRFVFNRDGSLWTFDAEYLVGKTLSDDYGFAVYAPESKNK